MFDIGFSELMLLAIIALLVLGPERLPRAAKMAGLWLRRAKASWYSVKSELERELADEELKRSLKSTTDELRSAGRELDKLVREDVLKPVDETVKQTRATVAAAASSATAQKDADGSGRSEPEDPDDAGADASDQADRHA